MVKKKNVSDGRGNKKRGRKYKDRLVSILMYKRSFMFRNRVVKMRQTMATNKRLNTKALTKKIQTELYSYCSFGLGVYSLGPLARGG